MDLSSLTPKLKSILSLDSKEERMDFCNENFDYIAHGYNRAVYALNEDIVLKLTLQIHGQSQNKSEYFAGLKYKKIIPKVYGKSNKFALLLIERVNPIDSISELKPYIQGYSLAELSAFVKICGVKQLNKPVDKQKFRNLMHTCSFYEKFLNKQLDKSFQEFLINLEELCSDPNMYYLDFLKSTAYGVNKENKLIVLDCGYALREKNIGNKFFNKQLSKFTKYLKDDPFDNYDEKSGEIG